MSPRLLFLLSQRRLSDPVDQVDAQLAAAKYGSPRPSVHAARPLPA